MNVHVYVNNFNMMGSTRVAIVMGDVNDDDRRIIRFTDQGGFRLEPVPPMIEQGCSMEFPDDVGRAVTDALVRHYEGTSDLRTVRADLLYERKRVDDLIKTLGQLSAELLGSNAALAEIATKAIEANAA